MIEITEKEFAEILEDIEKVLLEHIPYEIVPDVLEEITEIIEDG